jgi:isopenicillin-N epimerase
MSTVTPPQPTQSPSRRRFLGQLARGSVGIAVAPLALRGAAPLHAAEGWRVPTAGTSVDEAYWQQVRAAFPLRDGIAPMNSANLCPAPRMVIDASVQAMRDVDADVSSQNRSKYNALREEVRERLAVYLGADADELAIVRNTSEANNIIVGGLPLGEGDEVVIFDQNHATNSVSWDVRAAQHGFSVRRVGVPEAPSGTDELVAEFVAELTPRTRAIAFSDISNVTGVRLPVAELCRIARDRGIHAHVDGAQSFGFLELDLHALGCDSYSSSAHKWFMGPKEAGILYVRSERVAEIWPGVVGVGWGNGATTSARGARKFETLGQRNDATTAGMAAALDLHESIGADRVEARVVELASFLKSELDRIPGAHAITPLSPELSGGVVIYRFDGVQARPLFDGLYEEYRVAGATTGGMRLCPHIYNTREDVERAIAGISTLVTRLRG